MDVSTGALLIVGLLMALSVYRFHMGRAFDLTDLLKENGRVSKISVAFMLTLIVTSWMMIHMTMAKSLTEGYFLAYLGAWVAPIVARIVKGTPATEKEV